MFVSIAYVQRSTSQDHSCVCLQHLDLLNKFAIHVLQTMTFVNNDEAPSICSKARSILHENIVSCDHHWECSLLVRWQVWVLFLFTRSTSRGSRRFASSPTTFGRSASCFRFSWSCRSCGTIFLQPIPLSVMNHNHLSIPQSSTLVRSTVVHTNRYLSTSKRKDVVAI